MEYVSEGLFRILTGLGKKVIIADSMVYFTGRWQTRCQRRADYWVAVYAFGHKNIF